MLTLYKASAGSGKTFTLALNYIRHLLSDHSAATPRIRRSGASVQNHRSILAITFTNAATEEMKTRIIKRLAELADDPTKSDYFDMLKDFHAEAKIIREAARQALSELLYDYSNFYVSTIDSFFQTVLRTFAREVDRQGDFELSLEQKSIIPEVLDLMLEELKRTPGYASSPLYKWIVRKAHDSNNSGQASNYFDREGSVLSALAKNIDDSMEEIYHSYGPQLDVYLENPARLEEFISELQNRIANIHSGIKLRGKPLLKMMRAHDFDDMNGVLKRIISQSVKPEIIDKEDFTKAAVRNIVDNPLKSIGPAKANFRKVNPQTVIEEFAGYAQELMAWIKSNEKSLRLYELLLESAAHLQFIALFRKELANYLRENNTLLIADTGELLNRIISDSEVPFIYERLGTNLSSLLIDEFQDTSKLQWKNLKPLVANSVAQGESLIIGDVKQSIYRFRNSDSSLLDTQVESDPDFMGRIVPKGTAKEENTNRRSAHDIVRFNNTIFDRLGAVLGMASYSSVIQHLDPKQNYPAAINLVVECKPEGKIDSEANKTWRLDSLAKSIIDQHKRGYKWKDIAILVNTHKQAREVISYFLENYTNIHILSNEALLLSNSPAVRTVMSMLGLVVRDIADNPRIKRNEDLDAEEANETPIHSKKDLTSLLTFFNYARSKGETHQMALESALNNIDSRTSSSLEERIRYIRQKKSTNIVTLLENIIASEISDEDRHKHNAFLTALQDRATAHCLAPDPSPAAFLNAYELNIHRWSIKAPNSLDAVKVMTIHASKGLEWPCVHIPFASWRLVKSGKMWFTLPDGIAEDSGIIEPGFKRDIVPPILRLTSSTDIIKEALAFKEEALENETAEKLDNLNKLYVAFTRAGRELDVMFSYNSKQDSESTRVYVENILTEIRDGATYGDDPLKMDFEVTTAEGNSEHGPLLIVDHLTTGQLEKYVNPKDDDKQERDITEPYVVVERPGIDAIIAVENISDVENTDIGIEANKEIAPDDKVAQIIGQATAKAAIRGTHLHAILADMVTLDNLDKAVDALRRHQQLDDKTTETYRDIIRSAFERTTRAKEWFDPANEVWREQSFFDPEAENGKGGIVRPDRIVKRPNGEIVVIDYKFVNSPTDKQRVEYHNQVRGYVNLLRRMGLKNVSGVLWYPRKHRIESVIESSQLDI